MRKTFKQYFKDNKAKSKALFKKRGSFIKYYMFNLMKLLSLIIWPLLPIVNMAEMRMLRNIKKGEGIDLYKINRAADNPKNYFTYIASSFMKVTILLTAVLLIGIVGGALFLLGMLLDSVFMSEGIVSIVLVIPAAISLLVFIFLMSISLVPVGYIIDSTDGINMTKVLHESFNALWHKGKWDKFKSYLFGGLIMLGYTGALILLVMLPTLIDPYSDVTCIISLVILLALIVPYLRGIAKFDILFKLYQFDIYEDYVRDVFDISKRISGVEIEGITINNDDSVENRLASIFDSTKAKEVRTLFNVDKALKKSTKLAKEEELLAKEDTLKEEPLIKQEPKSNTTSHLGSVEELDMEEPTLDGKVIENDIDNPNKIEEEPIDLDEKIENTAISTKGIKELNLNTDSKIEGEPEEVDEDIKEYIQPLIKKLQVKDEKLEEDFDNKKLEEESLNPITDEEIERIFEDANYDFEDTILEPIGDVYEDDMDLAHRSPDEEDN